MKFCQKIFGDINFQDKKLSKVLRKNLLYSSKLKKTNRESKKLQTAKIATENKGKVTYLFFSYFCIFSFLIYS